MGPKIGVHSHLQFARSSRRQTVRYFLMGLAVGLQMIKVPTQTDLVSQSIENGHQLSIPARYDRRRSSSSQSTCASLNGLSASTLWAQFLRDIHSSSRLPEDKGYKHANVTHQLLQIVSPRLPNSIKTVTRDWRVASAVFKKAFDRWKYIVEPSGKSEPPPLRILAMGGSVIRGTNCNPDIKGTNRFHCAWPYRLEQFLNQFFGGKVVDVQIIGAGGTNSETGAYILDYNMLPKLARNPDVIINGYATNDMHALTAKQADEGNMTLRDKIFDMTQRFVRTAMRPSCGRPAPLVLHLDDYIGNEQKTILGTTQLSQAVQVLANYYGFPSASYPDMHRDLVYADTRETVFSPAGWYQSERYTREIHPSATGHIAIMWVVAFNLLNLATTFCSVTAMASHGSAQASSLLSTTVPRILPPPLSDSLEIEHVSRLWREQEIQAHSSTDSVTAAGDCDDKCPFYWISGIDLLQNDPKHVGKLFEGYIVENGGWKLTENHQKLGFMPEVGKVGASITLEFADSSSLSLLQSVAVFYMKSYGDKWEGSKAKVIITARNESSHEDDYYEVVSRELISYHEKQTSEQYTEVFSLDAGVAAKSKRYRVTLTLTDGDKFKFMGIAVCR